MYAKQKNLLKYNSYCIYIHVSYTGGTVHLRFLVSSPRRASFVSWIPSRQILGRKHLLRPYKNMLRASLKYIIVALNLVVAPFRKQLPRQVQKGNLPKKNYNRCAWLRYPARLSSADSAEPAPSTSPSSTKMQQWPRARRSLPRQWVNHVSSRTLRKVTRDGLGSSVLSLNFHLNYEFPLCKIR